MTLALERTLLAWTRTALALMGFGFVVARLALFFREISLAGATEVRTQGISRWVGVGLVCLGVLVQLGGVIQYRSYTARLRNGDALTPTTWSLAAVLGLALAAVGMVVALYLVGLG